MSSSFLRARIFRVLRVTLIVLALIGAATWVRRSLTAIDSEQAVINAEIVQIRTPINGVLEIGDVRPGMRLEKGVTLFTLQNPRFGDRESVAQYNSLQSLVETVESELVGAQSSVELAEVAAARMERLHKAQLVARMELELTRKNLAVAERLVAAKTEQLARTRERAREMEGQMAMQKKSVVTMPEEGLVWSISGKTGETVDSNKLVMEVLNPNRIWVDAFFPERHSNLLKPGLAASIRSLDGTGAWSGQLQSIRAGVGRMAFDTTVAVPPPEMAKRRIAVRVDPSWDRPFTPGEFYGVGRSVEVTFLKSPHERTIGDALKERLDRAIWGVKGSTASAQAAQ